MTPEKIAEAADVGLKTVHRIIGKITEKPLSLYYSENGMSPLLDSLQTDAPSPEDRVSSISEDNARRELLEKYLTALSPLQRRVVELYFGLDGGSQWEQRDFNEVGDMMGISRQRAWKIYSRAMKKLNCIATKGHELRTFYPWLNDEEALQKIMASLNDIQLRVFKMTFISHVNTGRIAKALGISESLVKAIESSLKQFCDREYCEIKKRRTGQKNGVEVALIERLKPVVKKLKSAMHGVENGTLSAPQTLKELCNIACIKSNRLELVWYLPEAHALVDRMLYLGCLACMESSS